MKTLILAAIRCSLVFIPVTTSIFCVRPAQAYTVTLRQVGANVVATGSGAINLTGLSSAGFVNNFTALIDASPRPRPTPAPRPTPIPPQAPIQAWVALYNGPTSNDDEATAMAVDGSGNAYITGKSLGTTYPDFDYATIKYNSAGQQQWVARYNGPGTDDDEPAAIAVDDSGNVYVTGYSLNSPGGFASYATIKYNAAGQQQWVARYSGTAGASLATAIAVDSSGNVYVTGFSWAPDTTFDYATIKYNSVGQQQWVARYNGPGNFDDEAHAIAIDGTGNVYVTGGSWDDYTDYATVKYNSVGEQQWVVRYSGPGHYLDDAKAIALDNFGNVYVTGSSYGPNTESDYATVKYNAAGQQQWIARYNGPGNLWDYARGIVVDSSSDVYVTGASQDTDGADDYATIKYNSTGQQQWVARYNGPTGSGGDAAAIVIDTADNVYVTGYSSSNVGLDYATIKYSSAAQEQWVARYSGRANGESFATAIAVNSPGNVYVTGYSSDPVTVYDFVTIKYVEPTPTPTPSPIVTPRPRPTPCPRPTP